jgi:dolichol-phosphate mannosyltransferase
LAFIDTQTAKDFGASRSISFTPNTYRRLDLAVVLPTYNERENIQEVIARLDSSLRGLSWEAIVVDDDSPDGTADVVSAHAQRDPRIRLIHRVGRRGLASACIEGMMATSAGVIAVMDADLQHDDSVLPQMLTRLQGESLDVVVGTRNAQGGSMGEFRRGRVWLSRLGQRISNTVCSCRLTDPMSGFFMLRRSFFLEVVRDLEGGGFKILVDLLASSRRPVCLGEVGYTFGLRRHGESKLNVVVGIEYLSLILNKRIGGVIPVQLMLYLLVGSLGLITHLLALFVLTHSFRMHFVTAQLTATFVAMIENFFLNNFLTYSDRRFRGLRLLTGGARFVLACSFGAWANVVFADALLQSGVEWYLAGFAGIVLGSVWNLSISSLFTWRPGRRANAQEPPHEVLASDVEVYR